ncbi:MAG: hydroxymethylbilane synthase [Myxococcales bacterium]|nr:hydroxymethylbilane synthase [Myxococcales bacterium]
MKIRIATRRSPLALIQTRYIAARLQAEQPDLECELLKMSTIGDRRQDVSLSQIGGKGLFVSELEQAVLDGRADLAVHSMKDLPAELAAGLSVSCIPEREDPRDALVTMDGARLDDLEAGCRIGTNSLRRTVQLRRQRGDVEYAMLRGSVNTRLEKLEGGQYRAIVLACAGLRRLELFDRPLWPIPVTLSVPAVGQGALAVESRDGDDATNALLAKIEHAETRACVGGERAFLAALGGDCHTPLGGHARLEDSGSRLRFEGVVGGVTGDQLVRVALERYTRDAELAQLAVELGEEAAQQLLAEGAAELIREASERAAERDPRARPS